MTCENNIRHSSAYSETCIYPRTYDLIWQEHIQDAVACLLIKTESSYIVTRIDNVALNYANNLLKYFRLTNTLNHADR